MSEDGFELVMAAFKKATPDKTEYLHHALNSPPFTDYQDTFSAPLSPSIFADFITPSWLPVPDHILRLTRVVYPASRGRRQKGYTCRYRPSFLPSRFILILTTFQLDETDTRNESYVCFRRREIRAVRKTRASQTTFSDKLIRLQNELATTFEITNKVIARETLKKEAAQLQQEVWNRRIPFDIKGKFSTLHHNTGREAGHCAPIPS